MQIGLSDEEKTNAIQIKMQKGVSHAKTYTNTNAKRVVRYKYKYKYYTNALTSAEHSG